MESHHHANNAASWKEVVRDSGANPAENYERFFVPSIGAPIAVGLMEAAALRPGEDVLDVACGTGLIARLAAAQVGESGSVTGLDVNPLMLQVARDETPAHLGIDWLQAPAESIPLDDASFDSVLCQMGLMFFEDKPGALREFTRVLRPGGRVALNLPGPAPALFEAMHDALGRHFGAQAAGFVTAVFALHDPKQIESLLADAGFRDVDVRHGTVKLELPAPSEFLWQYILSTPLAGSAMEAGDEGRAALERDVVGKWSAFEKDGVMTFQQGITTATARK